MKKVAPTQTIQDALAASPFLNQMSARHLRTLADCAMPSSFNGGELIFKQGDVANRFYLLLEGSAVLESRIREQETIHIQTVGPGDVIGWSWLFPPYVWHFDARAMDPVKVLFMYGTRLRERCEDDHDFGYELVKRMAELMMQRLQATCSHLFEMSDLAMRSQWEALQLTSQLAPPTKFGAKHVHSGRPSTHFKPQSTHKK